MKRWIASLLCLCMVLTMAVPTVMADDSEVPEEVAVAEISAAEPEAPVEAVAAPEVIPAEPEAPAEEIVSVEAVAAEIVEEIIEVEGTEEEAVVEAKLFVVTITGQPTAQTVKEGETATFTVTAVAETGHEVHYQWKCNGENVGSDSATLTFPADAGMNGNLYSCVVTDVTNGSVANSNTAKLTVTAVPTVSAPANVTVAQGETATFTVSAEGTRLYYQWQVRASAGAEWVNCSNGYIGYNTNTLKVVADASKNGYEFRCVVTNAEFNSVASDAARLTVGVAVEFTKNPVAQTVFDGERVTFTAEATGLNIAYLWQVKAPGGSWSEVSCTTNTLTFEAAAGMDGYEFRCIADGVASEPAVLTVLPLPKITYQPSDVLGIEEGHLVVFSVGATGVELTYQWQYRTADGSWTVCGEGFHNGDTDILSFDAKLELNNCEFRCVVTDVKGHTAESNAAKLTVLGDAVIVKSPADVTTDDGKTAKFTVEAEGAGLTYQWQQKLYGGEWSALSGETETELSVVASYYTDGAQYRCVVTDQFDNSVVSDAAVLTVVFDLRFMEHPENATVLEGVNATFIAYAAGSQTLQWQYRTPANRNWVNCTNAFIGFDSPTLEVNATMAMDGYEFRCVATNEFGQSVTSDSALLVVKAAAKILKQPVNQTVAEYGTATFTVVAEGYDLSYQWQYRKPNGGWVNCSATTAGFDSATLKPVGSLYRDGYKYRCVITDAFGVEVISNAVVLSVKDVVMISKNPVDQVVPANGTATFTVTANGDGLAYHWQYRKTPTSGWQNCSAITAGYNTPVLKPVASVGRNGYSYRCIVTAANGVSENSGAATLIVAASVVQNPENVVAEDGRNAAFYAKGEGIDLTYKWQYQYAGINWTDCSEVMVDGVHTYHGYDTTCLEFKTSAAQNGYKYRCVVTDAYGYEAFTTYAQLKITAGIKIVAQPVNQSVMSGKSAVFTVEANGEGLVYQWQWKSATKNWTNCTATTAGYNTKTLSPVGTATRNGYQYRCVITDVYGTKVTSNAATLTVTQGVVLVNQPQNAKVPANSTAVFTVSAQGSGLQYRWQYKMPGGNWKNCSSVTAGYNTAKLTPVATAGRNAYQYRCIITAPNGQTVTSNAATLQVTAVITEQPASQTVTAGATAKFKTTVAGVDLIYQWQAMRAGTSTWQKVAGATASTLQFTATSDLNGCKLRCVVKDAYATELTTSTVTLTVAAGIQITAQPQNANVAMNDPAKFTVTATGTGLKYQWQWKSAVRDWTNCSSVTAGYNTNTLSPIGTTGRNGYQYRCVITDALGNKVISNTAVLNVH